MKWELDNILSFQICTALCIWMLTLRKNALVFCGHPILPLALKNTSLNPNSYEVGGGWFSSLPNIYLLEYFAVYYLGGFQSNIQDQPVVYQRPKFLAENEHFQLLAFGFGRRIERLKMAKCQIAEIVLNGLSPHVTFDDFQKKKMPSTV